MCDTYDSQICVTQRFGTVPLVGRIGTGLIDIVIVRKKKLLNGLCRTNVGYLNFHKPACFVLSFQRLGWLASPSTIDWQSHFVARKIPPVKGDRNDRSEDIDVKLPGWV